MDVTVTQAGADSLAVSILAGQAAGNEGTLHIKVMTAKEGRVLYEGDMNIACFENFDTGLTGITAKKITTETISLSPSFNPDQPDYIIDNAPAVFTLTASAVNPQAFITINGITGKGIRDRTIAPVGPSSEVLIRVELPHGAGFRNYSIVVNRTDSGNGHLEVSTPPTKTFYPVQTTANTGFDPTGMTITYISDSGPQVLFPSEYTLVYNFNAPGLASSPVRIIANDLNLEVETFVSVVGLSSLTASGPDGTPMALSPLFAPGQTVYDLGSVPYTAEKLQITAVGTTGASLTVQGVTVTNGVSTVALTLGSNSIPVEISLGGVDVSYTLTVVREDLSADTTLWVSAVGSVDGNGSEEHPYAAVNKALEIAKTSALTQANTVTIVISGTITGTVDISGSGYPKIVLKGTGTDAGVLDANVAGRVLNITGGNKVTLSENLTLKNGYVSSQAGGGVRVSGSGSSFTMTGGTIEGNKAQYGGGATMGGGGVYVEGGGNFTMEGGTIQGNETTSSGGGVKVYGSGSTFTMSGDAVIQHNTANNNGGGVYVEGGGAFIKTGGTITGSNAPAETANTALVTGNAVYLSGGKYRDTTVGTGVNLYAAYTGSWSYVNPDGGENTEGNWNLP
jgi:hypothetical protein